MEQDETAQGEMRSTCATIKDINEERHCFGRSVDDLLVTHNQ